MIRPPFVSRMLLVLAAAGALAVLVRPAPAADEKQKAQNKKANAEAPPEEMHVPQPVIAYLFPAGGQRGTNFEATIGGSNLSAGADLLAGVEPLRITGEGVSAKLLEVKKGKDSDTARVAIAIAPDAATGERDVRFVNKGGASNRYRFLVGDLPEIREVEPNSTKDKAQKVPTLPVVINGQIDQDDRDYFRFTAHAGQTLVFDVAARRIQPFLADAVPGWFDACLTLFDADGRKLASVDDQRLKLDSVIVYTAPRDGDLLLLVEDIIYRGRSDFVYRLTVGELPYLTAVFPLGGRRGTRVPVALSGANLPTRSLTVDLPADAPARRPLTVATDAYTSNAVPFAAGDHPEIAAAATNDSPAKAQRVTPPVTINGHLAHAGDNAYFTFHANAGQKLVMEIEARRLESPLDSVLTLYDGQGKELAQNDDTPDPTLPLLTHQADSRLAQTFTAAGDYVLRLRDAQAKGGDDYAYRLTLAPPRPDFALRITPDNPRVACGDSVVFTVNAQRRDGFAGEIALAAANLPPGATTSDLKLLAGQDQTRFTVTVPAGTPPGLVEPRVTGTATIDGQTLTHAAEPAESVMQAFSYTHIVPTRECLLTILEPGPVTVAVDLGEENVLRVSPNSTKAFVVKATRKPTLRGPVAIALVEPPPGFSLRQTPIPPEKDETQVTLNVGGNVRPGQRFNLILAGTLRAGKAGGIATAAAIPVEVIAAPPPPPPAPAPTATPAPAQAPTPAPTAVAPK